MEEYIRLEFKNLCRLCISYSHSSQDILEISNEYSNLTSKIFDCLSIKIEENDPLPKKICKPCLDKLESYNEFKLACSNSDATLQCYYSLFKSNIDNDGAIFIKSSEVGLPLQMFQDDITAPLTSDTCEILHANQQYIKSFREPTTTVPDDSNLILTEANDVLVHENFSASNGQIYRVGSTFQSLNSLDKATPMGFNYSSEQCPLASGQINDVPSTFPLSIDNENIIVVDINKCNFLDFIEPSASIYLVNAETKSDETNVKQILELNGGPEIINPELSQTFSKTDILTNGIIGPTLSQEGVDNINKLLNTVYPGPNSSLNPFQDIATKQNNQNSAKKIVEDSEIIVIDDESQDSSISGIFDEDSIDKLIKRGPKAPAFSDDTPLGNREGHIRDEQKDSTNFNNNRVNHTVEKPLPIKINKPSVPVSSQKENKAIAIDSVSSVLPLIMKQWEETLKSKNKPCQKSMKYKCAKCNKWFKNAQCFKKHVAMHPSTKSYKCVPCQIKFQKRKALIAHFKTHQVLNGDKKAFKCPNCSQLFGRHWHLNRHAAKHQKVFKKELICHICSKTFCRKEYLSQHILSHSKVYLCETCGSKCKDESTFHKHKATCCILKFTCKVCSIDFNSKTFYLQHVNSNCGQDVIMKPKVQEKKQIICHLCSMKFNDQSKYNMHIKQHKRVVDITKDNHYSGIISVRTASEMELSDLAGKEETDKSSDYKSPLKSKESLIKFTSNSEESVVKSPKNLNETLIKPTSDSKEPEESTSRLIKPGVDPIPSNVEAEVKITLNPNEIVEEPTSITNKVVLEQELETCYSNKLVSELPPPSKKHVSKPTSNTNQLLIEPNPNYNEPDEEPLSGVDKSTPHSNKPVSKHNLNDLIKDISKNPAYRKGILTYLNKYFKPSDKSQSSSSNSNKLKNSVLPITPKMNSVLPSSKIEKPIEECQNKKKSSQMNNVKRKYERVKQDLAFKSKPNQNNPSENNINKLIHTKPSFSITGKDNSQVDDLFLKITQSIGDQSTASPEINSNTTLTPNLTVSQMLESLGTGGKHRYQSPGNDEIGKVCNILQRFLADNLSEKNASNIVFDKSSAVEKTGSVLAKTGSQKTYPDSREPLCKNENVSNKESEIHMQTTDLAISINDNLPDTLLTLQPTFKSLPDKPFNFIEGHSTTFVDSSLDNLIISESNFESELDNLIKEAVQTLDVCPPETYSVLPVSDCISQADLEKVNFISDKTESLTPVNQTSELLIESKETERTISYNDVNLKKSFEDLALSSNLLIEMAPLPLKLQTDSNNQGAFSPEIGNDATKTSEDKVIPCLDKDIHKISQENLPGSATVCSPSLTEITKGCLKNDETDPPSITGMAEKAGTSIISSENKNSCDGSILQATKPKPKNKQSDKSLPDINEKKRLVVNCKESTDFSTNYINQAVMRNSDNDSVEVMDQNSDCPKKSSQPDCSAEKNLSQFLTTSYTITEREAPISQTFPTKRDTVIGKVLKLNIDCLEVKEKPSTLENQTYNDECTKQTVIRNLETKELVESNKASGQIQLGYRTEKNTCAKLSSMADEVEATKSETYSVYKNTHNYDNNFISDNPTIQSGINVEKMQMKNKSSIEVEEKEFINLDNCDNFSSNSKNLKKTYVKSPSSTELVCEIKQNKSLDHPVCGVKMKDCYQLSVNAEIATGNTSSTNKDTSNYSNISVFHPTPNKSQCVKSCDESFLDDGEKKCILENKFQNQEYSCKHLTQTVIRPPELKNLIYKSKRKRLPFIDSEKNKCSQLAASNKTKLQYDNVEASIKTIIPTGKDESGLDKNIPVFQSKQITNYEQSCNKSIIETGKLEVEDKIENQDTKYLHQTVIRSPFIKKSVLEEKHNYHEFKSDVHPENRVENNKTSHISSTFSIIDKTEIVTSKTSQVNEGASDTADKIISVVQSTSKNSLTWDEPCLVIDDGYENQDTIGIHQTVIKRPLINKTVSNNKHIYGDNSLGQPVLSGENNMASKLLTSSSLVEEAIRKTPQVDKDRMDLDDTYSNQLVVNEELGKTEVGRLKPNKIKHKNKIPNRISSIDSASPSTGFVILSNTKNQRTGRKRSSCESKQQTGKNVCILKDDSHDKEKTNSNAKCLKFNKDCNDTLKLKDCSIQIEPCKTLLAKNNDSLKMSIESEASSYQGNSREIQLGKSEEDLELSKVNSKDLGTFKSSLVTNDAIKKDFLAVTGEDSTTKPVRTIRILLERFDPHKAHSSNEGKVEIKPQNTFKSQPYNLRKPKKVQTYICTKKNL